MIDTYDILLPGVVGVAYSKVEHRSDANAVWGRLFSRLRKWCEKHPLPATYAERCEHYEVFAKAVGAWTDDAIAETAS